MSTITATGNFMARPNTARELGVACEYHWHGFDHTVLPLSGLWQVTAFEYAGEGVFDASTAPFVGSVHIGPALFATARPDLDVRPWALVKKDRWHRIELVSKTLRASGQDIEVDACEFWCCWSYRTADGEVVEYDTGWPGQVS